ncbi:MAG: Trm112 family protein [Terracidiphilus sp.]
MPENSPCSSTLDPAVLALLACPVCRGDLRREAASLVCAGCGRAYPIVDGIPALIADGMGAGSGMS